MKSDSDMNLNKEYGDNKERLIKIMSIICVIIFLNIFTMYSCVKMGCYEISLSNMFHANLLCNACTDFSYNLYKYQMEIYFAIGGMFLKTFTDVITKTMSKLTT